ncbi:MAG: homoserine kinase [Chloroflexi bacterium]|jgi:homoserine kinase|nr:MAG: homoserine kinase [Chloroflexota bacterium]
MKPATIAVPATSANLGPGFDCLGLALEIWNYVKFTPEDAHTVSVKGEGSGILPQGPDNLLYIAATKYFEKTSNNVPGFSIECENQIPLARGLGSSSAAIVAGLFGACLMNGDNPDLELLWEIAVEMEGHADNVTPALFGGFQIVVTDEGNLIRSEVPLPKELKVVIFVPEQPMPTQEARGLVPQEISLVDAIYNMSRVGLLVNSLSTGKFDSLHVATRDRLHQDARQALLPEMKTLFTSALDGGALGVCLSGAGSSVLALSAGNEITVAREMEQGARIAGIDGSIKITQPTPIGVHSTE